MLRAFALALVIASLGAGTSACVFDSQSSETASADEDPQSPPSGEEPDRGGVNAQCQVASDCELAASTCCECPSFAVPAGQGFDGGCEDVECEPSGLCPAVEASCSSGQCVMICSPIITNQICAFGFERDAAGCLQNVCASSGGGEAASCSEDSECVQIPADCCGCSRGGQDQAVPSGTEADELDSLNCPSDPACPEIDVCDADEVPRCIAGSCVLSAEPSSLSGDEILCGTPDLPACAAGSSCVLNDLSAKDANELGVGVCKPE